MADSADTPIKSDDAGAGRGRRADSPVEIPVRGWWDILKRVKDEITSDSVGLIAAGVAFYGLLAIFPAIAVIMAIAGLLAEPATVTAQLSEVSRLLPTEAAEIILEQAKSVTSSEDAGLSLAAVIGFFLALYSSSKGMDSLITGINIAYEEKETRGFIKRKMLVLGLTLFGIALAIVAFALMVIVPAILAIFNFGEIGETIAQWIRWPILFALAVTGIAVLYRWAPDRADAKWRWITPGATAACILWIIGTAAFAIYVRNFSSYNETFGTLGGVVILLMWLWLTAFIVLLGAEFDAEMEAQTRKDSTTGPSEPMGQRGAVKADSLGH